MAEVRKSELSGMPEAYRQDGFGEKGGKDTRTFVPVQEWLPIWLPIKITGKALKNPSAHVHPGPIRSESL